MEQSLFKKQLPTTLKKTLQFLILSLGLSVFVCLLEGIIFTNFTSEISHECDIIPATIIQTISCYLALITLLLFIISIFRMSKSYILIAMVLSILFKFISFIMMKTMVNQIWGECYFSRLQITSFFLSDAFWIILLLFYYNTLSNLYKKFPEIFYSRLNINLVWQS
ncbi:unnamed protein product [Paramecium pentaurelia]|uniref:Transmembrane protein n=1 Tax=Paramecium pentaurelia TaxID=43138 RepID=A0A8S1SYL4_9CILI|nr:unnamed protein product [Paramecium pentaurelia]